MDAYNQILATQDTVEMWFIKVILLGAPRLGKTTMRRRLTGEIDNIVTCGEVGQPSTGVLETGHNVVIRKLSSTTALITPSEWLAMDNLAEETSSFLQCFHSRISEKYAEAVSKPQSLTVPDDTSDTQQISPQLTQGKSSPESCRLTQGKRKSSPESAISESAPKNLADSSKLSICDSSSPTSVPSSTKNHFQNETAIPAIICDALNSRNWRRIKTLWKDTGFIKMEDAGGQPEFMDMLPALTSSPALYLLFCKLTDELLSLYNVSYLSPSGESTIPVMSTYTMEEVLFVTLASITCLKSSSVASPPSSEDTANSAVNQLISSCNNSVAYIVGTHKDLVSEEQIAEFDEKLQQSLLPTAFYEENIVQFASKERMVLPVDNMHGEKSEIKDIRMLLEKCLKEQFEKLSIPASWLVLSLHLRSGEERTTSLESVLQLARELGIPRSEVKVALWFLHHYAGVLMYFPDLPELKDTVICDNQIIYDSTTNLIINTFRFRSVGKKVSEWFKKTGLFSVEDIRKATADSSGDFIPLKKLVKLLQHLNILASFVQDSSKPMALTSCNMAPKEMHFMPCVLQNASHEELKAWLDGIAKQGSLGPLLIRYKCGFVPIGVFPALIANLAGSQQLVVKLMWEGMKKNRVQFHIGKDFDTITLISQPKYYAVHISRRESAKTPMHEVCATVRELVESTLKTVTSRMNYKFTAEYQLGFECPSHPGREHLCVVDSDDASPHIMCCLENVHCPVPLDMQPQHLVWFGEVSSPLFACIQYYS